MDPILVVKTPVYYRPRPPGLFPSQDCLRSTWILAHGKWEKVEDRATPLEQQDCFDRWVERACFQYHPVSASVPVTRVASRVSPVTSLRDPPASQERPGSTEEHAVPCPTVHRTRSSICPQLTITTSGLYIHETHGDNPTTVHAAPSCTARVINTLVRVVHGGSPGWGSLLTVIWTTFTLLKIQNEIELCLMGYPMSIIANPSPGGIENMRGRGSILMFGDGRTKQHWCEFTSSQ